MVDQRNRLSVVRTIQPGIFDPPGCEFWIDPGKSGQEAIQQLILIQLEILMIWFQVVPEV